MRGPKPPIEIIIATESTEAFVDGFWASVLGRCAAVPIALGNADRSRYGVESPSAMQLKTANDAPAVQRPSTESVLPEPAPHYAEIIRLNAPDFHPTVESFDLSAALANPATAPKLEPLDTVRIFSRYDFELPSEVWIGGEVRRVPN